jgi:hypothetical protein
MNNLNSRSFPNLENPKASKRKIGLSKQGGPYISIEFEKKHLKIPIT